MTCDIDIVVELSTRDINRFILQKKVFVDDQDLYLVAAEDVILSRVFLSRARTPISKPQFICINRDKAGLDIFWLRDESLEESDNLPDPDVLVQEIVDDLEAALEQFREIAVDLGGEHVNPKET
jgi:hypothetical protein